MGAKMNVIWSNDLYGDELDGLEDERENLNIEVGEEIIIIADLGLWDGRHQAYKLLNKTNIADCLTGTCGDCEPCSPPVREGENTDASPV